MKAYPLFIMLILTACAPHNGLQASLSTVPHYVALANCIHNRMPGTDLNVVEKGGYAHVTNTHGGRLTLKVEVRKHMKRSSKIEFIFTRAVNDQVVIEIVGSCEQDILKYGPDHFDPNGLST